MTPRVAFTLIGGKNWTGGYNYLLNLLRVVQEVAPGQMLPVLLAGTDVPEVEIGPFARIEGCEIVQKSVFNEDQRSRLLFRSLLLGRDARAISVLRELRVDVVFESALFLGWRLGIPSIAWIPDFQHRYLPRLFSLMGWWKRELGFRAQISSGRMVMVSSEDSKQACKHFYPSVEQRVQAVRFAVRPPKPLTDLEARAVSEQYGLPQQYFFMPNQFWAHKNHMLVMRALKLLKQRGKSITVMATGKQIDPRNVSYVPSLMAAVKEAGLEENFLMPGMIPYEDLMPLMQASTALLNPSLFEGWSTTVEEARAAGVPMILSDIAVHREQGGDKATFFDPHSADSLAEALSNFKTLSAEHRQSLRDEASLKSIELVNRFANEFVELLRATARKNRTQ